MTAKTRSRRIRDQRKHLRAMGILLIVMAVFCVTAIGSLQLKQKNQTYQNREAALEKQIADETERSKEIEDLETYTKTKKYVKYKDVSASKCKITGLAANTKYKFKVVALKKNGSKYTEGEYATVSVTTKK